MAAESIYDLRRPGFPKQSNDGKSDRSTIEYIGLEADLRAACPANNAAWGDYPGLVADARIDPLEMPGDTPAWAILTVLVEYKYDALGTGTGVLKETSYDIDWTDVSRTMYEHPWFVAGGTKALTDLDRVQIEQWKVEQDTGKKAEFRYTPKPGSTEYPELTENAKFFAAGYLLGVEYWVDKAPVVAINQTYVNGPPPAGTAGMKETPSGVPNLPTGYEWLRNTDRSHRAGGQLKWDRSIQYLGAQKILVDKNAIYWPDPSAPPP